jgi:HAD superfamily hydrolase (TIGR01549 family)
LPRSATDRSGDDGPYNQEVPLTPPVETLFLDAGGVLVFPNWQRVSDTLARHGVTAATDALRAADPHARLSIDDGYRVKSTNDADRGSSFFHRVFERAGVVPSPAVTAALDEIYAYHTAHNLWEDVPADVVPALHRFRALGFRLAVASNANGALHRAFDRLGLTPHLDCICDSFVEGVEKPDPRFFEKVLERSGARRESTLHIGDLYHVDVVGARNAGLRTMLLDPLGLYEGFDVERVKSLGELADRIG